MPNARRSYISQTVSISMNKETVKVLDRIAAELETSRANAIRTFIRQGIEKYVAVTVQGTLAITNASQKDMH